MPPRYKLITGTFSAIKTLIMKSQVNINNLTDEWRICLIADHKLRISILHKLILQLTTRLLFYWYIAVSKLMLQSLQLRISLIVEQKMKVS